MKNILFALTLLCWWCCFAPTLQAQNANCSDGTVTGSDTYSGTVFFNYGGIVNAFSVKNRTTASVGEPLLGDYFGQQYNGVAGFYSRFLLPPTPPLVTATEGDLKDRIQVDWAVDPLSPSPEVGFNIYRDGAFIGHVEKEIRVFVDFNVEAGKFYNYQVTGVNAFGEGRKGSGLGFLNPNGVVTGQVKTFNGSPVADAEITLTPTLGAALEFTGDDVAFAEFSPAFLSTKWTVSCWVKIGAGNNNASILDFGSPTSKNWWLTTNGTAKGVKFNVGAQSLTFDFATDPDGWHHVAGVYSGTSLLLYVDGTLIGTVAAPIATANLPLFFGRKPNGATNYFTGKLDEVRFFNRQLSQTEINQYKSRTVNSDAEGLAAYWKFDEGVGTKAYDISPNGHKTYLCGALWTDDRSDVVNGAVTDETGFYKIEGINYGGGTIFTAAPSKKVYTNYALEFNAANSEYTVLTDSVLLGATQQSSIEFWMQNFENIAGFRTVLANEAATGAPVIFRLNVTSGAISLNIGGVTKSYGDLGTGYQHIVVNLKKNGASIDVSMYKNGTLISTQNFATSMPNFGLQTWQVGARKTSTGNDQFFSGLIDEVAFYDTTLTLPEIQMNFSQGLDPTHPRLRSWFPFNESRGTAVEDIGPARTGKGTVHGALWSNVTGISSATMHEFQPNKQLVTLNASNTSTDKIDFTDLSTVGVSGYVRFDGTNCFAEGVEIIVNGQHYVPPVFTDADGKFVVDMEPGATATLTPTFKNHSFAPASWQVSNVVSPVAGILFRNLTKRTVRGQMAGNDRCRLDIIPNNAIVKVKVATLDGCFEKELSPDVDNGRYVFSNLPPLPVTVAVTQHSNNIIYDFFQLKGAQSTDLTEVNDTIDFIYYSPPEIEISALDANSCGQPMLEQSDMYTLDFRVFQPYEGGVCYLDTALLTIDNEFSDKPAFDTLMTTGKLRYRFPAGMPNLVPPHLKTLTIEATANDVSNTAATSAVVLGKRPRQINFTSTTPEIPILILRDPPGDASSAFVEKGKTVCNGWSIGAGTSATASEETAVSLGFDTEIATGIGVEKTFKIDVSNTSTFGVSATVSSSVASSMETCVTATEVISTSDGDGIIGDDADVYMGGALNLLFGITDDLRYNSTNCTYFRDTGVVVFPEKFNTTFIYSDYQIRNVVIPNLEAIGDTASADSWRGILQRNADLKEQAVFERNFSFDAGVVYESSSTTETTKAMTFAFGAEIANSMADELGLETDGVGLTTTFALELTVGVETEFSDSETNSLTVGYSFSDDDIGDNFTVDVKKDRAYGTPVFKLISGNTSCPYEANTVPRDGVSMTVDKTIETNVPQFAPAVFRFTIGNISQTDEERGYILALNPASNPEGAIVNIQGLGSSVPFTLAPFGAQDVVVTVERGPVAFDYENLEFVLYSECEGLDSDDPNFAKTINISVHYLEPCSPIDIGFPLQNWVMTPALGNTMFITLNSFDKNDPDLELIRAQYRRSQGDGAWINIVEVQKAELDNPVFKIVEWNTAGLQDGLYEIRAVTQCFGSQNAGISHVIAGKFERQAPEIFGTPEPTDGVLSLGDEISITFTEPIRCDLLIQADIDNNNNVGLYDVATGTLIDAVITCSGDKIIIVPNVPNIFLDKKFLRVEINDIKDLAGNNFVETDWEFFVDRNLLDLEGGDLEVTMYEGEEKVVLRALSNVGGSIATFGISGSPSVPTVPDPKPLPDWFNVFPTIGSLLPGEEVVITYKFDNTLPQGLYRDTIYFNNVQGDERVIVNLRVLCPPPVWEFNPADYPHAMNLTARLNIEGELSEDEADVVAAFIDGELRGTAQLKYLPTLDDYMVFMTVYGHFADTNKTVLLEIWDASDCLRYGEVEESFIFQIDNVIGTVGDPVILHTNSKVRRDIPLTTGWNWISFNLALPNTLLNAALSSLEHPQNDLIKSQASFAEYFSDIWIGSLPEVNNTSMFQFRADVPDTITMLGTLIDPATVQIPINSGWNWIGYVPNYALPVSEALAGLSPENGNIIKGQTAFAQYLSGFGWLGSLQFLEPPKGYQLYISNPGTLTYPLNNFAGNTVAVSGKPTAPTFWNVDPSPFEHSMTLVGMLSVDELNGTIEHQELGAFAGGELRGAAQAIYVAPLNAYLFFLTMYANASGEQLTFKLYDSVTGQVSELAEKMYFAANLHQGSIEDPLPFTLTTTVLSETAGEFYFEVAPNPFHTVAMFRFGSVQAQEARLLVSDVAGRIILQQKIATKQGLNSFRWDAGNIQSGVYFIRLETSEGTIVRKVVKE